MFVFIFISSTLTKLDEKTLLTFDNDGTSNVTNIVFGGGWRCLGVLLYTTMQIIISRRLFRYLEYINLSDGHCFVCISLSHILVSIITTNMSSGTTLYSNI